jgi:hypothetical protein
LDRASPSSAAANSKIRRRAASVLRGEACPNKAAQRRAQGLSRLRRTLGPLLRPVGKVFVVFGDPQHRILGWGIAHLLGDSARFFRATAPVRGVVDERCRHVSPQAAADALACVSHLFQNTHTDRNATSGPPWLNTIHFRPIARRLPSTGRPPLGSLRQATWRLGRRLNFASTRERSLRSQSSGIAQPQRGTVAAFPVERSLGLRKPKHVFMTRLEHLVRVRPRPAPVRDPGPSRPGSLIVCGAATVATGNARSIR